MEPITQFTEDERRQTIVLLEALLTGWMLVDEEEGFDYVLLFSESRTEMEGFKPSRLLVQKVEELGLIRDREATFGSRHRETLIGYQRSAPDWKIVMTQTLCPIVYFYEVTSRGRDFLKSERTL